MSSAGGIGLMLDLARADGRERHVLDFIGPAPARRRRRRSAPRTSWRAAPSRAPRRAISAGWLAALERFGRCRARRVLAPAIESRRERRAAHVHERRVLRAGGRPNARPLGARPSASIWATAARAPGKVVTYKELAATFRQVAEGGAEVVLSRARSPRPSRARSSEAGGWLCRGGPGRVPPGVARARCASRIAAARCARCRRPSRRSRCSRRSTSWRATTCARWGHNSVDYLHHLIEAIKLGSADRLAYAYSRRDAHQAGSCRRPTRRRSGRASTRRARR